MFRSIADSSLCQGSHLLCHGLMQCGMQASLQFPASLVEDLGGKPAKVLASLPESCGWVGARDGASQGIIILGGNIVLAKDLPCPISNDFLRLLDSGPPACCVDLVAGHCLRKFRYWTILRNLIVVMYLSRQ